jgi:hypothetical protein
MEDNKMSNSIDMMHNLIHRAKNLEQFSIITDVPEDFRFNGLVPFDMEIKAGVITAKVFGLDFNEAIATFDAYLETCK